MRKIYLLLDEWSANRVFVEEELKLLTECYDVTIICQDEVTSPIDKVTYHTYRRTKNVIVYLKTALIFLLDSATWHEGIKIISGREKVSARLSDMIRFYVNAELFADYLVREHFLAKDEDAIFYSYWFFWKCFAVTKKRKFFPKIKVISRTHGYDLYYERSASGYQPFKLNMDCELDKLIFVSDYGMKYYFETFSRQPSERYALYYLGTRNSYTIKRYYRKEEMVIVSCSSLIPLKRVELIVQALSLITDIPIRWVHFGGGVLQDEISNQATKVLTNVSNIDYQLWGTVSNEDIMQFYRDYQVDLFITTTESEGGNPVSIMEAMSFGIPVLATDICNLPTMIEGNGMLVSANPSPHEIVEAIRRFWKQSDDEIARMREKSRSLWEEKYHAEKNYAKFIEEIMKQL